MRIGSSHQRPKVNTKQSRSSTRLTRLKSYSWLIREHKSINLICLFFIHISFWKLSLDLDSISSYFHHTHTHTLILIHMIMIHTIHYDMCDYVTMYDTVTVIHWHTHTLILTDIINLSSTYQHIYLTVTFWFWSGPVIIITAWQFIFTVQW